MTLRRRVTLYLVLVHLAFGGAVAYLLLDQRPWLLLLEAALLVSLGLGLSILRHLRVPVDLARTGAELISEQDFTCKFLPTGHVEMDQLVQVYNRMIDRLREERTRLEEQHHLMDNILAVAPSGILTLDFDERVAQANPRAAQLLQTPVPELLGKRLDDLHAGLAQELRQLEVGKPRVVALGGQRRVRCHRGNFVDRGHRRSFLLLDEITDELRQSERAAYERIIRLLSHEVNNSAAAVGSLLQSCLTYQAQIRAEDRQDFTTALEVAATRTANLNSFMKGYADVVRLPPPRTEPVDPEELLRHVETLFRADCQERRIQWRWDVQEHVGPAPMDRSQMEQAFVNIARNAVEAIDHDGRITVRLGRREGRPFAVVEDTGCGIPPDAREGLFTPFFSTKEHGQGIGLTLVQQVLSRHGFDYALDSDLGSPTRFTILF